MRNIVYLMRISLIVLLFCLISDTSYSKKGKPVNINLPPVETLTTKNGIKVFYIRDELPQLTIVVSIGFGTLYENSKNAGISDLIARTLSIGGSEKYPADKLHQSIESAGGRLAIKSSWERTIISLRVLERHSDLAFDIIGDLLKKPNLEKRYIENAKSLMLDRVRRKRDRPFETAFEKVREIIFSGRGYGSVIKEETIKSITREEMLEAWNRYFKAKNIIIGVSTSIDLKRIKAYLKGLNSLGEGKKQDYIVDHPSLIKSLSESSKSIYLIPKDIPQATIVVGTVAPDIKDDSIFALKLMNYILGGGSFNSRLMMEIRIKRGLSYAVQSILRFRKGTGVFLAYAQTNYEKADITLSLLVDSINKIASESVSTDELKLAKSSINNSYIFEFDNSLSILSKYISLEYNGLPAIFITEYLQRINIVNKEEILESSKELFRSGLIKVVVGKRGLKAKLEKYGNVVIIDNP